MCLCHTEGFVLSQDSETPFDAYLSIWSLGTKGNDFSLWWRLKYIWRILRTGQPYGDHICLHAEDLPRITQTLLEYAYKAEHRGKEIKSPQDDLSARDEFFRRDNSVPAGDADTGSDIPPISR